MASMTNEEVIAYLRELAAGLIPPDKDCGLCHQVGDTTMYRSDLKYALVQSYQSWLPYTGYEDYPVPSPEKGVSPRDAYQSFDRFGYPSNKWTGPYGDLRRDLCRHFADYLEKHYVDNPL